MLFFALLIGGTIATSAAAQTAAQGDIFESGNSPSGSLQGVIISITPIGIHRLDVKVQNPANGNIHSVTVEDDVVSDQGLHKGQRVTEYTDPETGAQTLAPTTFIPRGGSLPGQLQGTGDNPSPTDGGNNGGVPPPQVGGVTGGGPTYPAAPPNNGGFPTNPIPSVPPPPRTGGVTGGGGPTYPPPSVPNYPAPKMVGNYVGKGSVNGVPVEIGGPGATPIPAGAGPGTPVTATNQSGIGPWRQFRGTLQSGGSGYYVQFNQGLYQGYDGYGRPVNGWFPISPPQIVPVNAG